MSVTGCWVGDWVSMVVVGTIIGSRVVIVVAALLLSLLPPLLPPLTDKDNDNIPTGLYIPGGDFFPGFGLTDVGAKRFLDSMGAGVGMLVGRRIGSLMGI